MSSGFFLFVIIGLGAALGSDVNETSSQDGRGPSIRVVGGIEAREHEYPFLVSLYRGSGPGVGHFCGGSIIEPGWVLTAAHCVTPPPPPAGFKLVAGKHDLRTTEGSEQTVSIETIIAHPDYTPNFENDLALVKVTPPFTFTAQVKSIKLPNADFVVKGPVTVAGWGVTDERQSKGSPVLRKVTVNALDNADCANKYGEFIKEKMVCAGVRAGGKDACQGDSGGPLLCDDPRVEDTVCGLVSFGQGCARPEYAGVYTKVAFFSGWIHEEIKKYGETGGNKPRHEGESPRPHGTSPKSGKGSKISAQSNTVLTTAVLVILKIFQYY